MPNKKEIKVLWYLNGSETRYDNGKKGDTEANIKANLGITDDDINDMHWSELLYFNSYNNEPIICITHEGSAFVESYRYNKMKEVFYWIFGVATIVAATFAVIGVFIK